MVDEIAGWTFRELFFLYALSIIGMSFHHAFTNSVIYLEQYIREGTLDQLLCLPVNTLFYMVARRYTPLGLGNLIIGIFYHSGRRPTRRDAVGRLQGCIGDSLSSSQGT